MRFPNSTWLRQWIINRLKTTIHLSPQNEPQVRAQLKFYGPAPRQYPHDWRTYIQTVVFVLVHFSRNSSSLAGEVPGAATFGHGAGPMRSCLSDSLNAAKFDAEQTGLRFLLKTPHSGCSSRDVYMKRYCVAVVVIVRLVVSKAVITVKEAKELLIVNACLILNMMQRGKTSAERD